MVDLFGTPRENLSLVPGGARFLFKTNSVISFLVDASEEDRYAVVANFDGISLTKLTAFQVVKHGLSLYEE